MYHEFSAVESSLLGLVSPAALVWCFQAGGKRGQHPLTNWILKKTADETPWQCVKPRKLR